MTQSTDPLIFTFTPRWKEEIVCSCALGSFVLEMSMGVDTVWMPPEADWPVAAPDWALDQWDVVYGQLKVWCEEHRIPLKFDERIYEFADPALDPRINRPVHKADEEN